MFRDRILHGRTAASLDSTLSLAPAMADAGHVIRSGASWAPGTVEPAAVASERLHRRARRKSEDEFGQ